jgi:hypothetical protein
MDIHIHVIIMLQQRCINFTKILKPLGSRRMTWSTYHTERPQILGATAQNIVAMKIWLPRFVYPYIRKICHTLCRNCLLKQVIEGKIKGEMAVTRRRERRRKKLLDDLKDRRGYSRLKEEALDRTMWKNRFRRGFGPVARQNTEWWWY